MSGFAVLDPNRSKVGGLDGRFGGLCAAPEVDALESDGFRSELPRANTVLWSRASTVLNSLEGVLVRLNKYNENRT